MKYTLEQLKQFLLEPSFYGWAYKEIEINKVIKMLEEAIKHHEDLDNNILDGERQ
jgi:hypothetical protein